MDNQIGKRMVRLGVLAVVVLVGGCSSPDDPRGLLKSNAGGSSADAGGAAGADNSPAGGANGDGFSRGGDGSGATAGEPGVTVTVGCAPDVPDQICRPQGFPFTIVSFPHSDICDGDVCPRLTQPEPGKLCLSGGAPVPGAVPHFPVLFYFGEAGPAALGITHFSFAVDSPPPAGVVVETGFLLQDDCGFDGRACAQEGFFLPAITEPGTTVASMADFVQIDPDTPYQSLAEFPAPGALKFEVREGGDFAFCVHDLKFLNAADDEVVPSPDNFDTLKWPEPAGTP